MNGEPKEMIKVQCISVVVRPSNNTANWSSLCKVAGVAAIHKKGTKHSRKTPGQYLSYLSLAKPFMPSLPTRSHHSSPHTTSSATPSTSSTPTSPQMTSFPRVHLMAPIPRGHHTFIIAGACNRLWHSGLITKLRSMGVSGNLLHLFHHYLQDRSLSVVVNGYTWEAHLVGGGRWCSTG